MSNNQKFIALYFIPSHVVTDWMNTDPETRKAAEQKMGGEWQAWASANAGQITGTYAAGKTKRITASGIADAKNDVMLYSTGEAESHEAAAKLFENHPHLQIPEASIEVVATRPM